VAEPDILICDEVTSALDVSVQATIVELLKKLQYERNLSIIFITHNLALVRSLAESVAVLANGRIIESGDASEIIDHPSAPYTAQLMADLPRMATASPGQNFA
jgi:peptide/nickel transport system ATP-binding protein